MSAAMHLAIASLLFVATIPGAGPAEPPASSTTAAQVEKLTADGKADDEVEKGRAAVAAHPDDVDLRLALARGLAAQARHVNRQVNVKVSKEDIARGEVAVPAAQLGDAPVKIDYDSGPFEEAMLHLDFGIKRAPQRQDLRVFQCFLLTDAGRIERAKGAITAALTALPKTSALATTMAAYGAERAKRDDPEGAAELMAPVAAAFPGNASILVYGNVLTRLGRKPDAFATLDRAVKLAPADVRIVRTKAVSAMLLRDFKRAQGGFDAAFRLGRGIPDQFASYAAAYGLDPAGASVMMRELGTPSPSSDAAVIDLANAFVRAGKAGASSSEAMTLARNLVTSEQYLLAIPVLDRALKASPANADAKSLLAKSYRELGCPRLAK
jgi:tetratricopeptide (TPR) repeat protein